MDGDLVWSNLIGELYDAASGDTPFWVLAPRIASAFNSEKCVLQVRNGFAGPVEHLTVTSSDASEVLAAYDAYDRYDTWASRLSVPSYGADMRNRGMADGQCQESTVYRQHGSAMQSSYSFDAILPIGSVEGAFAVLGIHRGATELPFSIEEKRQMEMFLPHLKRALQLRERLGRSKIRQEAFQQVIETLALGVMLVTCAGQVQFANPAAEDLLRRRAGLAITENRLHATLPPADAEFQRLLKSADASNGRAKAGGLIRLPRQGVRPVTLSIYPFQPTPSSTDDHAASVLIFIGDPELHKPPRKEVLAQIYGLTGAEAKLFEAVLAGQRLQDYADRCSISLQTVKTQLSHLFHKTGSSRQADLVRDGLSNPIFTLVKPDDQKTASSKSLYGSITRSGDTRQNSGSILPTRADAGAAGITPYTASPAVMHKGHD